MNGAGQGSGPGGEGVVGWCEACTISKRAGRWFVLGLAAVGLFYQLLFRDGSFPDTAALAFRVTTALERPLLRPDAPAAQATEDTNGRDPLVILLMPHKNSISCEKEGLNELHACADAGCRLTCDVARYNSSHAVLFNLFYSGQSYPVHHPPGQKWVVQDLEAPPQSRAGWPAQPELDRIKHQFNVSAFFTADSDVPFNLPPTCRLDPKKYAKLTAIDTKRTRNVVWFVSHCKTQSQREAYVAELKRYIDVDVYGLCGNNSCGSRGERKPPCAERMLNHQYRFYLSFENSLCDDYISEKVWKIVSHRDMHIIPVVMGAVNYSALLPPKTFIDVRQFASPRALAAHLHNIADNATLFAEYLHRKDAITCKHTEPEFLCRLCRHLQDHRHQVETIPDITDFWGEERRCTRPQDFIPGDFWH